MGEPGAGDVPLALGERRRRGWAVGHDELGAEVRVDVALARTDPSDCGVELAVGGALRHVAAASRGQRLASVAGSVWDE
jgi:hypothetical protein